MERGPVSVEDLNKEVVRNVYDEALNKRNFELLEKLVSEEYIGPNGTRGAEGFRVPVCVVLKALPDARWEIQELIADSKKVVVRWKLCGTHLGPFQHIAPTNRKVLNDGLAIYELRDGKITGNRVMTDRLGFQQSLGALPDDLSTLPVALKGDEVAFIDRFFVPVGAISEFLHRMKMNREFIQSLPGFIEDHAYGYRDEEGNLISVTTALWENHDAIDQARAAVNAEYSRLGFDPTEMLERLQIVRDRGVYTSVKE